MQKLKFVQKNNQPQIRKNERWRVQERAEKDRVWCSEHVLRVFGVIIFFLLQNFICKNLKTASGSTVLKLSTIVRSFNKQNRTCRYSPKRKKNVKIHISQMSIERKFNYSN